jgi:hypothetical protein
MMNLDQMDRTSVLPGIDGPRRPPNSRDDIVVDRGAAHFLARELRGLVDAVGAVAAREASHVVPASAGANE